MTAQTTTSRDQRQAKRGHAAHRRALIISALVIVLGAMVAPLSGYVYEAFAANAQETQEGATGWSEQNPRAQTWTGARSGTSGSVSIQGPYITNELIQNGGENWRNLRNGPVAGITPWLMAVALVAIGLFHIFVGRNRIEGERSGRKVLRWRTWERVLHWFTAITFIIMAITGLSLLFGRAVLIPLLGHEGFAVWATAAKVLHNWIGPFFTAGVLLIIVSWIKDNIPNRTDLEWFKKGGGMVGGHASAGRMNGGEKVWFWFIATFGVAVCVTGLILDFPNFAQSRGVMQVSNLIHAVVSIAWIALAFGHIYIGTAGTEGAFEGMATGYVSEEWAKQHHDLWFEEIQSGQRSAGEGDQEPAPGGPAHGPAQRHPD